MDENKITIEEVRKVAKLAHLTLTEDEMTALRQDLDGILGYVTQLEAVDVSDVEPTTHAIPLEMPLRQDTVVQTLTRDEVLSNAPDEAEGMFRVPRIVEGGN
jgi:aspartyl-tRNA(Asn)/glutamyl-tRNA(Gln) amidotransferase subunit C